MNETTRAKTNDRRLRRHAFLILSLLCLPIGVVAQEAGDTIVKQGRITEDLYLAGGTIDMLADVDGDVIAAGGQINIDQSVSGDILVAGGNISIRARVGDDVRAMGGNITVSGAVGDEAVIAGGNVLISPTATVGGRALLGGGNVRIEGKVGKGVKAAGNRVVIDGDVTGDVELFAETVEIGPRAMIRGNLTYHSREEAKIASTATITGAVTHERFDVKDKMHERSRVFHPVAKLALYITLMVTGIVLFLLFPATSVGAARTVNESPWKSLGLGFAILAATPLVVVLLCVSFVGVWLALLMLALYLMSLLLGFLTGIVNVGEWGLRFIDRAQTATKGWRVLSIIAALLALWLVRFVPILGGLVVLAVFIFGLGALALYLWRRYVHASTSAPKRRLPRGAKQ
jgi:hypothetical protein